MPKMTHTDLTVAEAAQALGVHRKTILRAVKSGRLRQSRKLPGRTGAYLIPAADVERLAAERAAS